MKNWQFWIIAWLLWFIVVLLVFSNMNTAHAATPVTPQVTHSVFSAKQRYAHAGKWPASQHYNIYTGNAPDRNYARLGLTRQGNVYKPSFTVSYVRPEGWAFPCIGQGANHGMYPSPTLGRKTWYPVRANYDGDPYATAVTRLTRGGNWQSGFDAWFEPQYDANGQRQQYGGTELMILTAVMRHGKFVTSGLPGFPRGRVYADGRWWNVSAAVTGRGAKRWHRIYFTAASPLTSFSGALNPFFRAAEHFGMLNGGWWLTGIEYGFEINAGGTGLTLSSYDMHGVRSAPSLHTAWNNPPHAYRVPRVTGQRQATAVRLLNRAGYKVRLLTPYRRGRTLVVSSQSVRPGTAYPRGRTVSIRSRIR